MQIASLNSYAEEIEQTSILFQINSNDWLLGNLQILLIYRRVVSRKTSTCFT
jgi:hypothetical protein